MDHSQVSVAKTSLAVVVFTLNEEANIAECLDSIPKDLNRIVVDSGSTDSTVDYAVKAGAEVINFNWNGSYPKKRQWTIDKLKNDYDWILFIDADERPGNEFINECLDFLKQNTFPAARVQLDYYFMGKKLKFGAKMEKVVLLRPNFAYYPNIEPNGMGIGDLEFHYQPDVIGRVGKLKAKLKHQDKDAFISWLFRHIKYAEVEADLSKSHEVLSRVISSKTLKGQLFYKVRFRSLLFFLYSFFFKFGFLDGRVGFDYAFYKAFYYRLIRTLVNEKKENQSR